MGLRSADFIVLVLYVGGVVGLGCWFFKKSRTTEEFMVAGRALPGWVVGFSLFGTFLSSISFLALPGKAYADNWNGFVFSLSLPLAAFVATRYFVPYYRKGDSVSAYSHLEDRFGAWARTYAVICYLLTQVARTGAILYLVALALAPLTGFEVTTIIIVTGVLVTLYTLLGGIEAVIWTDCLQSVVLAGGAFLCAILLLNGVPGGASEIARVAAEHGKFSLGEFGLSLAAPTFWVVLIYGLVMNLQNFGIDQSYVQRYAAARSDDDAKASVWMGALMYLPVSAVFFFIGTALFVFYRLNPGLLPTGLAGDSVFPHFIVTQLPAGVTGLLIAAIVAAAMSSVDTSLNSSATLILCDVYKRHWRKQASERESMLVLYGATLLGGLVGTGTAVALTSVRSTLDAWWQLSGVFSGGMLGLFLLGMIARRAGNAVAGIGVTAGVLVIIWMTLSPRIPETMAFLRSPFHGFMTTVLGTLTILLVGVVLSRLFPREQVS